MKRWLSTFRGNGAAISWCPFGHRSSLGRFRVFGPRRGDHAGRRTFQFCFVAFAGFDCLRALGRAVAPFFFCTFDAFLRLAMISPVSASVWIKRQSAISLQFIKQVINRADFFCARSDACHGNPCSRDITFWSLSPFLRPRKVSHQSHAPTNVPLSGHSFARLMCCLLWINPISICRP